MQILFNPKEYIMNINELFKQLYTLDYELTQLDLTTREEVYKSRQMTRIYKKLQKMGVI